MNDPAQYVLDANVFIEAARRYYAFDFAPGFWESLIYHGQNENLISIDRVKDELLKGQDELADWAQGDFENAFVSTDEANITQSFGEIINWVNNQDQFSDAAKADFAKGADGWLIAYAKVHGHTVVTHEELAPDVRRKVPIPNVCQAFQVHYVDTFTMVRSLGIRLVRGR